MFENLPKAAVAFAVVMVLAWLFGIAVPAPSGSETHVIPVAAGSVWVPETGQVFVLEGNPVQKCGDPSNWCVQLRVEDKGIPKLQAVGANCRWDSGANQSELVCAWLEVEHRLGHWDGKNFWPTVPGRVLGRPLF